MGVLFWSPNQFWSSSPRELVLAIEGYKRANTIPDNDNTPIFTDREKDTLKEMREKWG
ncbi:hypothetical protein DF3PA_70130 [Candidatus Defluviicoccus seviourii]|uniref:Phage tail assembly chaperone n=1 Tax=Candidatus Defluviicoccus seviourii TaxID=2565273 RepID=A0A564WI92_9PROT|nr:hypothetical protein DF3PA_70130 [Candidatus Defluviicoccus seviourii]